MRVVDSPVLQSGVPVQPFAVSSTLSSGQAIVVLHVTVGFGISLARSITFSACGLRQLPIRQLAVIVVRPLIMVEITEPVAPVDQSTVPPSQPIAVRLTRPPTQMLFALATMVGANGLFTRIVTGFEAGLVQLPTTQLAV